MPPGTKRKGLPKGKPMADRIDPTTKWKCISLKQNGTVAHSSGNGFFYLLRGLSLKHQNEYVFKVVKSPTLHVFIGVQEVIDDGYDVEYEYAWRIKLKDGVKFDDDNGMEHYTDTVFKPGDVIKMTIDGTQLSYS